MKGMAEGDFIRNNFNVHSAVTGQKLVECSYSGHESDHYGADDQMASDILPHLINGAALPVNIVAALEAGLVAINIDEARTGPDAPLSSPIHGSSSTQH